MLELLERAGGDGAAPVVLVHGAWHAAWAWEQWLDPIAATGRRVLAPSLPGHGGSPSDRHLNRLTLDDYVDAVLEVVGRCATPPALVGHSMAGAVIQRLLTTHPETPFAGVGLLAPVQTSGVLRTSLAIARHHPIPFALANATLDLGRLVATPELARAHFFSDDLPAVDVERHHARLQSESYLAFLGMMAVPRLVEPRPLGIPTLVLAAADDAIFTVDEVRATATAWGAAAEVVDGLAHDVMLDTRHELALDRLLAWLELVDG